MLAIVLTIGITLLILQSIKNRPTIVINTPQRTLGFGASQIVEGLDKSHSDSFNGYTKVEFQSSMGSVFRVTYGNVQAYSTSITTNGGISPIPVSINPCLDPANCQSIVLSIKRNACWYALVVVSKNTKTNSLNTFPKTEISFKQDSTVTSCNANHVPKGSWSKAVPLN